MNPNPIFGLKKGKYVIFYGAGVAFAGVGLGIILNKVYNTSLILAIILLAVGTLVANLYYNKSLHFLK